MTFSSASHQFLRELTEVHGPSFYVFWEERLSFNFHRLDSAFRGEYPRTEIAYSYKTNYVPAVCKTVHALGGLAEVVSAMEWEMASLYGVPPSMVIYNGPNKSSSSFADAIASGALVQLDSRRDWQMLKDLRNGQEEAELSFGLRVNFELKPGETSRFGVDIEGDLFREILSEVRKDDRLTLRGLHCHFPDRDIESFRTRIDRLIAISATTFSEGSPEYLNVGGGLYGELNTTTAARLGTPVSAYTDYAAVVAGRMRQEFGVGDGTPRLIIEPGTALVADAMSFVTTVIDVRDIRGRRVAVVDGSLFNVSPYSRSRSLPLHVIAEREVKGAPGSEVAGFTCIESDVITFDAPLGLRVGDLLVYDNVGSYSVVMKPPFILPSPPILQISPDSHVDVVRRRETVHDILATYPGV